MRDDTKNGCVAEYGRCREVKIVVNIGPSAGTKKSGRCREVAVSGG